MSLLGFIGSQYKHAKRYNQIIRILVKYGFEDYVDSLQKANRLAFLRKMVPKSLKEEALALSKWEKMRLACEELGPTFIKFGQLLSNRPDVLPEELIVELEKLQDRVPPISSSELKKVLETEIHDELGDTFKSVDFAPYASASIAQVHKAVLLNGQDVVLKIQRPNIKEKISEDIQIMMDITSMLVKRYPYIAAFNPLDLIENFKVSIIKELDFINESVNIQRFQHNFQEDENVYVPGVYKEHTTERLLVMEYIDGVKVSNYDELSSYNLDRQTIAKNIMDSYYKQVFDYGFFHADPHAGNIFALPGNRICFIDFGMMGSVMKKDIDQLASLFMAIEGKNVKKITRSLLQLSDRITIENPKRFEYDLNEFVNTYGLYKVHRNEMSNMINELWAIVVRHKLKLPAHFFLLSRSMVSIEGVVRNLDPGIKLLPAVQPYLKDVIKEKLSPIKFAKRFANSALEFGLYLEDLPGDIKDTIQKIKSGQIKVDLEHKGIDPLLFTLNRISKQIVAAVIVGALIVGSSLIILADMPPHWNGVSAVGIVGLILAAVLGFGMLRNLIKKDKGY